jgi:hypothetical protein
LQALQLLERDSTRGGIAKMRAWPVPRQMVAFKVSPAAAIMPGKLKTGRAKMLALANNDKEWRDLCDNPAPNPFVCNLDEWKKRRRERDGVLARISDEALDQFEGSLSFKRGGLAHAHFEKIQNEVGESAAFEVLELFGLSAELSRRSLGVCAGGNCQPIFVWVCTSNCKGPPP